MCASLTEIKYS